MYPTIGNVDLYEIPSSNRFDASATWTNAAEEVSVMLYVNNLTDEITLNEFIASGGQRHGFLGIRPTRDGDHYALDEFQIEQYLLREWGLYFV